MSKKLVGEKELKELRKERNRLFRQLEKLENKIFNIEINQDGNVRDWTCRELASICDMLSVLTKQKAIETRMEVHLGYSKEFKEKARIFRKLARR